MNFPQYLRVQRRRGGGKTELALNWVKWMAEEGARHFLLAGHIEPAAREFRDKLRERDHDLFERIKLQTAAPQGDEFRLRGSRYDAAVVEDVDLWPTVFVDPNDQENTALYSVLFDEILAHTFGPVLFTYTDPGAVLVSQIPKPLPQKDRHP